MRSTSNDTGEKIERPVASCKELKVGEKFSSSVDLGGRSDSIACHLSLSRYGLSLIISSIISKAII